jgi:hypothetical protein
VTVIGAPDAASARSTLMARVTERFAAYPCWGGSWLLLIVGQGLSSSGLLNLNWPPQPAPV